MKKGRTKNSSSTSVCFLLLLTSLLFFLSGSVTGFTPSTKTFLFTLQSPSSPPLGKKWPVYSSGRFRAIFRTPGRLQFGEDLLLNLTDRSVSTGIGYDYNRTNGSGLNYSPCGSSDTVAEVDDLEVLSPFGMCV